MFVDTHAHLNDEAFKNDLEQVIKKSLDNRVKKLIVVGFNKQTNLEAIKLANKYPFIYATVGIHPSNVNEYSKDSIDLLESQLQENKVVAVGECGLDYYWYKDNKELQKEVFLKQVAFSYKYKLPLIIHSRDAIQETYDLLKGFNKPLFGIMHGYSGSLEMAWKFIKLGFKLGIGGVVTFNKANTIKEVVKNVQLSNLVLETDCPYLTPHPYRGKRNEPSNIPLIAQAIADIKQIDIEEVMTKTTKNIEGILR